MIEVLHPGVFLEEVAFRAHPIEGVSTSQPDWTDTNAHDPGITLLEFPAYAAESLAYRMPAVPHARHLIALAVGGVVAGLQVHTQEPGDNPRVHMSAGVAWRPDGTPAS